MTDQIIRLLMGHGALGLLAALFVFLFIKEQAAHQATREKAEHAARALQKKYDDDLAAANARVLSMQDEHGEETRELLEQMNRLREAHIEREKAHLQTVEYFARQQTEAVEELAKIADILRRTYDRARR